MNQPITGEGKAIPMKIETQLNLEVEHRGEEPRRKQKKKEKKQKYKRQMNRQGASRQHRGIRSDAGVRSQQTTLKEPSFPEGSPITREPNSSHL